MLISVVLTVVVLNFHYRGPKKSRVPASCRRLVLVKIGPWLGFNFVSPEQLLAPILTPKPRARRSSRRDVVNGDLNRNSNQMNIKLLSRSATPTTTTEIDIDEISPPTDEAHSLTYNIEQILLKMQRQFDPSKIDDEQLKISILREILECQRLLLTIHAKKQNLHSQSLHDIYEEWKILAIIVDRICFIFYLVSMLAASIFFFVREPILKRNG